MREAFVTGRVLLAVALSLFATCATAADKTVVVLSGTTWVVPADFSSVNTVHALGAAGTSANGVANASSGATGGGGAYSKQVNIALTPGTTVNIQIGTPGAGDVSGNDTFLKDNSGTIKVLAESGGNAVTTTAGAAAGNGRAVGNPTFAGRAGRAGSAVTNRGAPGAPGASGPTNLGLNGGNPSGALGGSGGGGPDGQSSSAGSSGNATTGGNGGDGPSGTGHGVGASSGVPPTDGTAGGAGAGGAPFTSDSTGSKGSDEQLWTDTLSGLVYGPGAGGGGGAGFAGAGNGGSGGHGAPGGGGGSVAGTGGVAGTSGSGLLVIIYTPSAPARNWSQVIGANLLPTSG